MRVIARRSFMQHLECEHANLEGGEKGERTALADDMTTVMAAMRHYRVFDETFMSRDEESVQSHLEKYKKDHLHTTLGKSLVDFYYDVMSGEHDEALANHVRCPKAGWKKAVDWRQWEVTGWSDIVRNLDMATMSVQVESCTAPSGPRTLQRISSTMSDEDKEERLLREAERARAWTQAVASRQKLVEFVTPATWTEKGLQAAYERSSAFTWQSSPGERQHKVFLFSADLHNEDAGAAWASLPIWKEQMHHSVRFMMSKQGQGELLAFADGRARSCRRELEKIVEQARNFSEVTIIYKSSPRLGRRVAWSSDNREMVYLSLPVARVQMPVKPRASEQGSASGESTTHDSTYSGVSPMPWGSMPVLSAENKAKILGIVPSKPRVQLYDAAHGMPLFWSERKTQAFWRDLFADLGASCIVDTTPGCGTAACAAMAMELPYVGMVKNSCHANFLANVADRSALHMMRTKGSPLFHQEIAKVIEDHFSMVLRTIEHMESAEDTAPTEDVQVESVLP